MKTTKLVAGIIMIVLAVFIFFQSSVAGLGNALQQNGESGGSAGVIVALLYLIAGIVYLVTQSKEGLGGDIANLVLLLIAWLFSFMAGSYSDLIIWGWLAFIIGVGFFVWHLLANRKKRN